MIYALLLRIVCRRRPLDVRDEMLATHLKTVAWARQRGWMAGCRAAIAEYRDLLLLPWRADPLPPTSASRRHAKGASVLPSAHDWRNAIRRAIAQPAYAATVVAILALGIALNTVVFSVADATLFRGLPYPNGSRLVEIFSVDPGGRHWFPGLLPASIAEWRRHPEVFQRVEAWNYGSFLVTGGAEPEQIAGAIVTPGLFDMLGVRPGVGRTFAAGEGRDHVAVISDGLWRQRFGGNADLPSLPLVLNDVRYTVVGVMPPHFRFPAAHQQLWIPVDAGQSTAGRLQAVAALTPALTMESAQQRLDIVSAGLTKAQPQPAGWMVRLTPMRGLRFNDTTTRAVQVLTASVIVVLLIACANVANLFFAQALARRRELAIRSALGASRLRLARELLIEGLVLGIAGGVIGLALAYWGLGVAVALAPTEITRFNPNEIRIDTRMLVFTTALTLMTGLLFGMLPAWRASRASAGDALRARTASAGSAQARIRGALVVLEVALSVLLLVAASLLVRSFLRLEAIEPGFRPDGLAAVSLSIPADRYPAAARRAFLSSIQDAVGRIPGIEGVAVSDGIPTSNGALHFGQLQIEGRPAMSRTVVLPDCSVSPGYFQVVGIPLRSGRTFTANEDPHSVIVSETFARRGWPGESALGRRFRLDDDGPWKTVVGIAGDVRQDRSIARETDLQIYSPYFGATPLGAAAVRSAAGSARTFVFAEIVVRAGRPLDLVPAIKAAIWAIDPGQPIGDALRAEDLMARSLTQDRFAATLMVTFAIVALVLAAAGLYAVLAQLVAQRRQEIGIRMALGAASADVLRMVLSRGFALAIVGIAIGLAAAWAAARTLSSQLYGVAPHDGLSFSAVPVLLASTALLASWLPARRAIAVDPVSALRSE